MDRSTVEAGQRLWREGSWVEYQPEWGYVMGASETQQWTKTKLNRITWLSKRDPAKEFESLMHLFNEESLTNCFHRLDKNKAVGIDGIDKTEYGVRLEENILGLLKRMKDMAYRPGPVREVRIPKEGKPGITRPLGISNLEDKIVQGMMKDVQKVSMSPCSWNARMGSGRERGAMMLFGHFRVICTNLKSRQS
jgi:RNA-directed DNA polymerase